MKNALSLTISMLAVGLSSSTSVFAADEAESISAAIAGGDASLSLRYRYELVDEDTKIEKANASTLKTRLTFQTLEYKRMSAKLEFDNNTFVFDDSFNDTTNGKTHRPVVADPEYTEVNQAYLDYKAPVDTLIRYGRQRVNLDNQRHVGGVAWRQNEQTYDALALVNQSLANTSVLLAAVHNVNTIVDTNINGQDHYLLNINNKSIDGLSISAFAYALEDISGTYGLRAEGKLPLNDITALYAAEYAQQETDNAAKNETDYIALEAGVEVSGITAKLGYESLGSDDGNAAFQTPLATKHKFNGWADKFLATPNSGLEDTYLSVSTKALGPKVAVVYHQFDSDVGGIDFGSEIDLLVAQKFTDNYSGLIKYAQFSEGDAGNGKVDTSKLWLQLVAKF